MTASAKGTVEEPGKNVRQKAGLNRSILESCWGLIREFVSYKALLLGILPVLVRAACSSQECSACGHVSSENRKDQSSFLCTRCGHKANADTNASMVLRKRAVALVLAGPPEEKKTKKVSFAKSNAGAPGIGGTWDGPQGCVPNARGGRVSRPPQADAVLAEAGNLGCMEA